VNDVIAKIERGELTVVIGEMVGSGIRRAVRVSESGTAELLRLAKLGTIVDKQIKECSGYFKECHDNYCGYTEFCPSYIKPEQALTTEPEEVDNG